MKAFMDSTGRSWTVTINVDAIMRVRGLLSVNLAKIADDNFKLLDEILGDPVLLVDIIYCLCKQQADSQHVSDEDFGRSMAGDVILTAATAMFEELSDFFPRQRARDALKALLAKGRQVSDLLVEQAALKIEALDPAAIALTLSSSAGSSQASSGSPPAP